MSDWSSDVCSSDLLSVNHGWRLRSELLTAPGAPVIDRLDGDTAQSRHSLNVQLVAGKPGMGVTLDGNWQSGFRLRAPAGSGQQDYRHRPEIGRASCRERVCQYV